MLPEPLETLPFDSTLTPENAWSRGFEWDIDVLRDEEGRIVAKEEILRRVNEEGCKLGQPYADRAPFSIPYGLYRPLGKLVQPQK